LACETYISISEEDFYIIIIATATSVLPRIAWGLIWSYIPCYALRKKLGLRVSSNRGEKANDLVVAQRQKHNGMSWSKTGSSGLANVNALFLNKENENWINKKTIEFRLCHNDIKDSVA
jgi:hypothetical protein